MKMLLKKKDIKQSFICFSVGNDRIRNLLRFQDAAFYTQDLYGWCADIYSFWDIALVNGRNTFGKVVNFDLLEKYENKAMAIWNSKHNASYKKTRINNLLEEFIQVLKEI